MKRLEKESLVTEMITVIVSFQLRKRFLRCPAVCFTHRLYLWHEVIGDFLFCDTTNSGIRTIETDVTEIIENGEKRNLRELGDASNEDKLFILVISLQDGKDLPIDFCTPFMARSLPGVLQRRVVFIDKYGYFFAQSVRWQSQ